MLRSHSLYPELRNAIMTSLPDLPRGMSTTTTLRYNNSSCEQNRGMWSEAPERFAAVMTVSERTNTVI